MMKPWIAEREKKIQPTLAKTKPASAITTDWFSLFWINSTNVTITFGEKNRDWQWSVKLQLQKRYSSGVDDIFLSRWWGNFIMCKRDAFRIPVQSWSIIDCQWWADGCTKTPKLLKKLSNALLLRAFETTSSSSLSSPLFLLLQVRSGLSTFTRRVDSMIKRSPDYNSIASKF
jgi:hypothetical protein